MNKRYFTALIAIFLMAVSAIAQTNTYNMVLTLKDKTVITIGPNDLEQLDFKEGNVTVSGTNITDLMNQMKALRTSLADLQDNVAYALIQIKNNKEELQSRISALDASVTSSQKQIKDLQDNMSAMQKDVANNKDELMEYTDAAKEDIRNEYLKAIDISKAEIMELINALQAIIGKNTADIEVNTADIAGNKANIKTNTKNINTNKNAIQTLITQLRNLGVIPNN